MEGAYESRNIVYRRVPTELGVDGVLSFLEQMAAEGYFSQPPKAGVPPLLPSISIWLVEYADSEARRQSEAGGQHNRKRAETLLELMEKAKARKKYDK